MGDMRQFKLIRSHMPLDARRVLEVGSRNYGNKFGIRSLFPESLYVGTDLTPGDDVDVVCDFCQPHGPFPDGTFDCVVCCSVLEHTRQPWVAAANIEAMLREGGALFVSVPWIFPFHGYPNDYFRFSPEGVRLLFPGIRWTKVGAHSGPTGPFFEWDPSTPNRHLRTSSAAEPGTPLFRKCLIDMIGIKATGTIRGR